MSKRRGPVKVALDIPRDVWRERGAKILAELLKITSGVSLDGRELQGITVADINDELAKSGLQVQTVPNGVPHTRS